MATKLDRYSEQEILAECSDEEEYDRLGVKSGNSWCPFPTQISSLYYKVFSKSLEFAWKCPGERRSPDDDVIPSTPPSHQNMSTTKTEIEPEPTDFDFEEEMKATAPQISRFGKSMTPKANKKKTQSLAGILSSMERHRLLDQKQMESKAPDTESS